MSTAVLDTNIMIDLNAGEQQAQVAVAPYTCLIISRIAYCEYLVWFREPMQCQRMAKILEQTYQIVDSDADIAWQTVLVRQRFNLKLPDAMIYATASVLGVPLLTRNTKDFDESMPGVHIPYVIEE
jgi:predicted nucleic acid-binding protein